MPQMTTERRTRVTGAQRTTARLILAALAVVLTAGLWRPLPRHGATLAPGRTDSALYAAEVERVARGESYYAVLGSELRARGYPTASVFNWRFPTLILGLAKAPLFMRLLLALVSLGVLAGTVLLFSKGAPEILILTILLQVGATASAFSPLAYVLHEAWAGSFIALSALLYTRGWFIPGAAAGLGALFLRELAAPYVAVCAWFALRERRAGELAVWAAGGILFAVLYALHANAVLHAIRPGDLAHPSWLQFGGLRFVLATIGFGGWFYVLPVWVPAFAIVLLLSSPWSPIRAPHVKATTFVYLALFAIVGQPFNQSWGLLTAPLWAIGYGLGAGGLFVLWRQAIVGKPAGGTH
jgi:hypothetical protein